MRIRHLAGTTLLALLFAFSASSTHAHTQEHRSIENMSVLFILSANENGYWLPEVLTPYKILTKAGMRIDFASPGGASGTQAGGDMMTEGERLTLSKLTKKLATPLSLSEVDPSDYTALYVPGGAGPMFDLYDHPEVNRITAAMYESGKPVSADCHGPAAFAGVRLSNNQLMVEGKKLTAKSNAEEGDWARDNYPFLLETKFNQLNANFSAAAPYEAWIVQDGNLLTGQNPASAEPLAYALLKLISSTTQSK